MKRAVSVLLSVLTLFAFAACKLNVNVKPFEVKGTKISEAQMEKLVEEIENAEGNTLPEGKWYKVDAALKSTETKKDEKSVLSVKISGKAYNSPIEYDEKFLLNVEGEFTETDGKEEEISAIKVKWVYIHGANYLDVTASKKDSSGKETHKTYTTSMSSTLFGYDFSAFSNLIAELVLTVGTDTADLIDGVLLNGGAAAEYYQNGSSYYYKENKAVYGVTLGKDKTRVTSFFGYSPEEEDDYATETRFEIKDSGTGVSVKEPKNKSLYLAGYNF